MGAVPVPLAVIRRVDDGFEDVHRDTQLDRQLLGLVTRIPQQLRGEPHIRRHEDPAYGPSVLFELGRDPVGYDLSRFRLFVDTFVWLVESVNVSSARVANRHAGCRHCRRQ